MLVLFIMDSLINKFFTIAEYPNYIIYPNGDIFSIKNEKFLKPRYDKDGYKRVSLRNVLTHKLDTVKIHQLVAMCFLGYKRNTNVVIDHIDNDRQNNYLHNLQVITPMQNLRKEHMKKNKSNGLPYYIELCKKGYVVKLAENKIKKKLGTFVTLEEAIQTRDEYFKELFINVRM